MPLVVKFADTPKEKDQKKLQQQTQSLWNAASTNALAALGPQYLAVSGGTHINVSDDNVSFSYYVSDWLSQKEADFHNESLKIKKKYFWKLA